MNDENTRPTTSQERLRWAIADELAGMVLPTRISDTGLRLTLIEAVHIARMLTADGTAVGRLLAARDEWRVRAGEGAMDTIEAAGMVLTADEQVTEARAWAGLGWAQWINGGDLDNEGERTMLYEDLEFPKWLHETTEQAVTLLAAPVGDQLDKEATTPACCEGSNGLHDLAIEGWASYLLAEYGNSWRSYTPDQRGEVYDDHDLPQWLRDGIETNEFTDALDQLDTEHVSGGCFCAPVEVPSGVALLGGVLFDLLSVESSAPETTVGASPTDR